MRNRGALGWDKRGLGTLALEVGVGLLGERGEGVGVGAMRGVERADGEGEEGELVEEVMVGLGRRVNHI